ncbi:hypothetical protein KY285_007883 [Solanum tuberosum]|nr:hypothetical protein KY285_007883 [Solanum tuberosum]
MGCTISVYQVGKKKKQKGIIPEVSIFVPSMRVPAQCDLQRTLKGVIPKDLVDRLTSVRNQIMLIVQDTDVSAIDELQKRLRSICLFLLALLERNKLPKYLHQGILQATSNQALAQVTAFQSDQ